MTQSIDGRLDLGSLQRTVKGELLAASDAGYDQARKVWNAMIDKRPSVIVRPVDAADVASSVRFAADAGLPVAVRCGGHSVAGKSACDDGLLIDLSLLKGIDVDPERRTVRAGGGVLWGELDPATQAHGFATPGGRVSSTGVGGFTLGGGYGWLSPKYGLACDNLVAAEVVTADGSVVHCSDDENADLMWGLRGGGGNFGVVTSYELSLHPVGKTVVGGMLLHSLESAADVLRAYREYVEDVPDDLATAFALFPAPPEPFIPPAMQNRTVLGILSCYCGDIDEGLRVVEPLKQIGPPAVDLVGPMPYLDMQGLLDPTAPEGWRWYNTGNHVDRLTDDAIDTLLEHAPQGLAPLTQTIVFRHGGAVSRIPEDATAFGNRQSPYLLHPLAAWQDSADDARHIAWLRALVDDMKQHATGGVYLNFSPEGQGLVDGFGPDKYARLVALKDRYDPSNRFRFNHNIVPGSAPGPALR